MSKIPPEIDQMLWTVAEQGNLNAETEFLRRYPVYREELLRRKAAVSGLRTSRPAAAAPARPAPRFVPKETVRAKPEPRTIAMVGGLALAALAVASYTVTTLLTPAPTIVSPPPTRQHAWPSNAPSPTADQHVEPAVPVRESPPVDLAPPRDTPQQPPELPNYEKPQSLVVKRAGLQDVLKLIEASTGMKVNAAPGMPDPVIAVEYHDMTAMDMLRDLGQRYQFTPIDQGDGSVIVYPAVDSTSGGTGQVRKLGG